MKRVVDTIKEVQYRRLLKRSFEPRQEFMDRSRELFLAEVAKRRVAPQLTWHVFGMRAMRYGVVIAAMVLIGTSGLVAYADNRDVSVDSMLYPLKRAGEQVRLAVTPVAKESGLRKELAQRRAHELSEIETKKRPDADGDVQQMRKQEEKENKLRAEFRSNIEAIEERKDALPEVVVGVGLCQAAQAVEKHAENGKSERYKKFEDRCKELLQIDDDSVGVATSTASVSDDDQHERAKESRDDRAQDERRVERRNGKHIEQE